MILAALFVILVFAIAMTQATQGFFSALIMTVLTVICCAGAVGTHEWIAVNGLAPYWKPDYAHPLALGVTFGLSLLILRLVFDKLIRRSCLLPLWVDRVGGGVCGLITGLIMVGVMATCVQMVPFGGPFLGFQRVPVVERPTGGAPKVPASNAEREMWLTPDRFAMATASLVSGGVFSGERSFFTANPDAVRAIGWTNSPPRGISRLAKPKSINIVRSELVQFVYRQIPGAERERTPTTYEPLEVRGGRDLLMLRVALLKGAKDERNTHAFTLRQFRLVGTSPATGLPEQYHPIAMQQEDASQTTNRHVQYIKSGGADVPVVDDPVTTRGDDEQVEIVFDLPKGFEPEFLEYKRAARVAVPTGAAPAKSAATPPSGADKAEPPPTTPAAPATAAPSGRRSRPTGEAAAPTEQPAGSVPDSGRGGNVRRATAQAGRSIFSDRLPMEMKSYRQVGDTEVSRSTLLHGHVIGEVAQQEAGTDPPITKFEVAEGKRLLQLNTGFLESRSSLGRAVSRAVAVAQNYTVMDDRGAAYPLVGKYAIADVDGTRTIEIQLAPDENALIGGGLRPFDRIKDQHLQGDYQLVMLFYVDPGAKIVSFSTGGDATRRDDLTGEKLQAPP